MSSSTQQVTSDATGGRRQPDLYWKQLLQLRAAAICIRLCRNRLARGVRVVELVKAVGSSGGIAGWVVWRDWPLLWSAIIAASQLLDATKHVFAFAHLHRAASDLAIALDLLCIDAEAEWEDIHAARVPTEDIALRRVRLARLQLEAEHKHFPDGLDPGQTLIRLAIREAAAYSARRLPIMIE